MRLNERNGNKISASRAGVGEAMRKKVKNPLIRRVSRELLGDWRKYLIVSLFLILVIGFVSGMYVANESMMTAARAGQDEIPAGGRAF